MYRSAHKCQKLAVTAPVNLAWAAVRRPKRPFIGQRRIARAWEDGVSDPADDPTCLTLQARWLWQKVARGVSQVAQAFVCDSGGWVSADDKSMRLQGEGYWHPHLQASKKLLIRAKTLK